VGARVSPWAASHPQTLPDCRAISAHSPFQSYQVSGKAEA
jgi:hypothetical protein